jgi:gamma-glutamylcyclotransferase (GGCT)/AIG2-like uncharacterized protein YtfP
MPITLFLYGTLHPDRAPAEIASAARRLTPLGPATIHARVYNLGEYPGAVLDDRDDQPDPTAPPLPGHLFAVPDSQTLAALDRYEDFRPHDPAASLFLRVETTATLPDGTRHTCQVYVYNGPLPPAPRP